MPRLTVLPPVDAPWSVRLDGPVVVGRRAPADVIVPDALVSRRHCRIAPCAEGWEVQDLDSANGTYVDGARVTTASIADGARIELGFWALRFEDGDGA